MSGSWTSESLNNHLTVDDLVRFRTGDLSAEETVRVGQHLAKCKECAAAARRPQNAAHVAHGFRDALRGSERAAGRRPMRMAAIAAAGLIGIVSVIAYRMMSVTEPAAPPSAAHTARIDYGRNDWNDLVNQALASGRVAIPDLTELAAAGGTVRSDEGAAQRVDPEGAVVESDRPRFSWPAVSKAATYEVVVYRGEREVLRSGKLRVTTYVSERSLERGAVYQWQVLVTEEDGAVRILPTGPAAPALIRILSAPDAVALTDARQHFRGDSLLLGTLEARYGLLDEARRDLTAAAQQHPGDAPVARLRDAVINHR